MLIAAAFVATLLAAGDTPQSVFESRIIPILKSPNPSSCIQCHLAGVDLKNYILPTPEATFASLRDQGLVDLDKPEQSKILRLIAMGGDDKRPAAAVSQKARAAEAEAFAAWIRAAAADPAFRSLPKVAEGAAKAGPGRPIEVVRHARIDRLADTFRRTVWEMRFRCIGCHQQGNFEADKHAAKHGEQVYWFDKDGMEATMRRLTTGKLIDRERPDRSLLLLKPLNEVKHHGGQKFAYGDEGYKAFRTWIEDYVKTSGNAYDTAKSLPAAPDSRTVRFGSQAFLRVDDIPADWMGRSLQARIYAWDPASKAWEREPIAVAERPIVKDHGWAQSVILTAPAGSARGKAWAAGNAKLDPGPYLVRVRVDLRDRLKADWTSELTDEDNVGQTEFEAAWSEGWAKPTIISAKSLRK